MNKNFFASEKEILDFLEKIDNGYKPTKKERLELSKVKSLSCWGSEEPYIIPKSISLLTGLTSLYFLNTEISNVDYLTNLTDLRTLVLNDSRIADASWLSNLTNLKKLSLSNTRITNWDFLSKLSNLRELDLSYTQITNIERLSTLTNLEVLKLSGIPITKADYLSKLINLQKLDLSDTSIINTDFLLELTHLCELYLRHTKITNTKTLYNLTNLKYLDLTASPITDISSLSNLVNLKTLLLGKTKITNILPLSTLKKLKMLSLWQTSLASIDGLSNLTSLEYLSLASTEITDISAVSTLKNLQRLYLSKSKITSLPSSLGNLKKLKTLYIDSLHLNYIPKELLNLNLPFFVKDNIRNGNGIYLKNSTLATQPISLFEQPLELIQAYYDAEQVPINEAKVIFLGDGGAGKTHTIQRIHNHGKKDEYKTETTPGIDITSYKADSYNRNFDINFWDFGGQEIMHAMHRCFLTDRTCYVVVVSNRWDLNGRARYWLKNIDSFAKNAPVILAVNQWDNIQEDGLDMNRLVKDFPNLVRKPVYYSAKNSTDSEFNMLVEAIINEAGKLDSTAMSFPAQWAGIRQQLLNMAEANYYIDKKVYHKICNDHGIDSPQIRTWLLEWFNDLGVCFSYHQDETEKNELASYKVLNPRWLTNAIYIIINEGKRHAEKGRMNINTIQLLLKNPALGVLENVTYSSNERDYVLDVMRKFNLSYSVSKDIEFIPALCDSETPEDLYPTEFTKHISYQMEYSYLPDSVVHQLMILSYKSLNPDKVWRKGLRLDIECVGLSAVVQMGDDDATLRIDIYAKGPVEPWKLLHNIRKDIISINNSLGLKAEDFIIIHTGSGDIHKTVNELLAAKEQGIHPYSIYNNHNKRFESYSLDELLGMTFGNEIMTATAEKAKKEKQPLPKAFESVEISIGSVNLYNMCPQPDALKIIELLVQHNCETNKKLMECLINALNATKNEDAKTLATGVSQDFKEKKNFLKRIEDYIKSASAIITGGKTIYTGAQAVIDAVQEAFPKIIELIPQIQDAVENLPFI